MDRKAAKELVHIRGWLERVDEISQRGKEAYLADALLQEAGDSVMMKLGEAANRLSRLGVLAPDGVEWALAVANRNFIIHQYDEINRFTGGRSRMETRVGPGAPWVGDSLGVTWRRAPMSRPSNGWLSSTDWEATAHRPNAAAT